MRSVAERMAAYEAAMEADVMAEADTLAEAPMLPGDAQPTPTHLEVVNLLERLLDVAGQAQAAGGTADHPMLGTALRVVRKVRPEIVAAIAQAPEAEMVDFLASIAREVHRCIGEEMLVWTHGTVVLTNPAALERHGLVVTHK